jgi:hypothetical protein
MATHNFLHLWDDRFLYITPAIQSGLTARSSWEIKRKPADFRRYGFFQIGQGYAFTDFRRKHDSDLTTIFLQCAIVRTANSYRSHCPSSMDLLWHGGASRARCRA